MVSLLLFNFYFSCFVLNGCMFKNDLFVLYHSSSKVLDILAVGIFYQLRDASIPPADALTVLM